MLHIVKTQQAIHSVLLSVGSGDAILLIEDAVYLANPKHHLHAQLSGLSVFVLIADIQARGIQSLIDTQLHQVDYSVFVKLTAEHATSLTWE